MIVAILNFLTASKVDNSEEIMIKEQVKSHYDGLIEYMCKQRDCKNYACDKKI